MHRFKATLGALTIGRWRHRSGSTAAENVVRFTSIPAGRSRSTRIRMLRATTASRSSRSMRRCSTSIPTSRSCRSLPWRGSRSTRPPGSSSCARTCTFHDGTPFTADDVIFSIERARAETADLQTLVGGIAAVEAIDAHTIRFTTAAPDPSLWLKLADVAIMSRAWAERHGVMTPADYNAGARGDLRLASREWHRTIHPRRSSRPRGRWVMIRNPDWWGTADYPHNVDRIEFTSAKNAMLRRSPRCSRARSICSSRRRTSRPGPDPPHPRTEGRADRADYARSGWDSIRAARSCARPTSRGAIRSRTNACARRCLMRSTSRRSWAISWANVLVPAGMLVAPGRDRLLRPIWTSSQPTIPSGRRRCLSEAGYPHGFRVTLDCPSEYGEDQHCRPAEGIAEQLWRRRDRGYRQPSADECA